MHRQGASNINCKVDVFTFDVCSFSVITSLLYWLWRMLIVHYSFFWLITIKICVDKCFLFRLPRGLQPRGVLPYGLKGMCRWMGSHFHDWFDYNGVAFSIELPCPMKTEQSSVSLTKMPNLLSVHHLDKSRQVHQTIIPGQKNLKRFLNAGNKRGETKTWSKPCRRHKCNNWTQVKVPSVITFERF